MSGLSISAAHNTLDGALIIWWLYILAYAYLQTTYPVSGMALTATLFLAIYLTLSTLFRIKRLPGDVLAGGVVLWTLVEACIGLHQLWTGHSNHHRYPMTGTFFNPGPYGTMLATGLVVAVALWRKYEAQVKHEAVGQYVVPGVLLLLACMLLDEGNRIVLVGNPTANQQLWELYTRTSTMWLSHAVTTASQDACVT